MFIHSSITCSNTMIRVLGLKTNIGLRTRIIKTKCFRFRPRIWKWCQSRSFTGTFWHKMLHFILWMAVRIGQFCRSGIWNSWLKFSEIRRLIPSRLYRMSEMKPWWREGLNDLNLISMSKSGCRKISSWPFGNFLINLNIIERKYSRSNTRPRHRSKLVTIRPPDAR